MLTKLTALKNHAGFIRYFKNTSWMMAEQFLRIIAGLFSYVNAFTTIFGGITKLRLHGLGGKIKRNKKCHSLIKVGKFYEIDSKEYWFA